jgi:predicted ATPase/class 3 adenylate cyclase
LDPESSRLLLGRYFEAAAAVLGRHGGVVEAFVGSSLVGVFGVPVAHEDDAERAVRAAAELRTALGELNGGLERAFAATLALRIGISTGEVVVGAGSGVASEGVVAAAARLHHGAAEGEVVLDGQTVALTREAVRAEPLSGAAAGAVAGFRLLAVGPRAPRVARRLDAPMVGRARERVLLEDAFVSAATRPGCVLVTVLGEAGVGKSRLAREFLAGVDARVLEGRCLSYGEGITYWPLVELLGQLGGVHGELLAGTPAAAAALASLLGESAAATSPEEIAWAARKLFEALARERPLVLLIDDLQWGEPAFLDLAEQVARLSTGAPILLLCLARPELLERRPGWGGRQPNASAIALEPLEPVETDELIGHLLHGHELAPGLSARIRAASEGNPLYVEEMLALAQASGGDEVVVPPSIKALLAARIDRLDPAERELLGYGAVEGEVFHRGAVETLTARPAEKQLAALVEKELLRPDRPQLASEEAYRFRHLLIRDAAYDALPKATRADLHERFAAWLEQHGAELVERDELVGYHLEQAYRYHRELGDANEVTRQLGERAAAHLAPAARRAATRGDEHAFVALVERALELGVVDPNERVWLQAELGPSLNDVGRRADGIAVLQKAEDSALAIGNQGAAALAAMHREGLIMARVGHDLGEHEQICRRALATFAEGDDKRLLALAERQLALVLVRQDRSEESAAARERALAHADACGDQTVRRLVMGRHCSIFLIGPVPAAQMTARCEEWLATTDSDRVLDALLKRCLGLTHAMAGRAEEAVALVAESSAILDELNEMWASYIYRASAAYARELTGDRPGAERDLLASWTYFSRPGFPEVDKREIAAAYALARFYCDEGRFDEAEQLNRRYADLPLNAQVVLDQSIMRQLVEARLAAQAGRPEEAVALAEGAVGRSAARGHEGRDRPQQSAYAWLALAEVQRSAGRGEDAARSAAHAIELYELKGNVAAAAQTRAAISR